MDSSDLVPVESLGISQVEMQKFQQMKRREEFGLRLTDKDVQSRPNERQEMAAVSVVMQKYDIIRVRSMDAYYYRKRDDKGYTYIKADDNDRDFKNFVRDAYHEIGIMTTGRKITSTVETLKEEVVDEVETIDLNIVEVTPELYWDGHLSTITEHPSGRCFIKLFDNKGQSSPSTIEINTSEIQPAYIKAIYTQSLRWLELLGGDMPLPEESAEAEDNNDLPADVSFEFISTWACGSSDVYNDMLKAAASVFMRNKPMGAFILTGLKRNGKSTYVKMMHTMLGRANTSALRLADLSSRHRTLTLLTSVMNAPDEETEGKDMDEEATANFKSMAAHEPVLLPVMYSPKPQWISTNFTMFCPMNTEPDWKGNSASACNQRSLIIPFHADLSKFDNSGRDFARETFTPMMYSELLGALFAIANYYKDKPMNFSETMKQTKEVVEEASDNRITYAKLFNKWFVGYASQKDVWNDYKAWCKMHDYKWVGQKELMFAVHNIGQGGKRTNIVKPYSDTSISVVRLGKRKGDNFFILQETLPELKRTIDDVLYYTNQVGSKEPTDNSVVESLERWYEQKTLKKMRVESDE